jgi:hypothetical protein
MTDGRGHGEDGENLLFGLRKLHFTRQKVNFFKVKFKISEFSVSSVVKFLFFHLSFLISRGSSMQQLYQMLRQTSRTFALSIEQLPRILRDAGAVAYLLLRVSDCLEDHDSLPVPRKIELLYIWAEVLVGASAVESLTTRIAGLDGSDPEVNVAQNAGMLLQQLHTLPPELQEIITRRARETTLGMARWQAHGPYVEDEAAGRG